MRQRTRSFVRWIGDLPIVLKLTVTAVTTTAIAVAVAVWLAFSSSRELLLTAAVDSMKESKSRQIERLRGSIDRGRQDAMLLSRSEAAQGILRARANNGFDDETNTTEEGWREQLESAFTFMLESKGYCQIRLIALEGDERITEIKTLLEELDIDFLKDEIPKAIEQSLEGVERVAKIVRSMKEFSHPGGVEKQMSDLNKAIESTITVARNEWKYVAEMVTDFDSSLPLVPCLLGDFNQVILNMTVNAAHAIADVVGKDSGEKGTITVTTRQEGEWAEIRISDTGAGMPAQVRAKVFDPFFATKDVGKGTGQGLAIAHNAVVQKHGGTIDVESQVGKGTVFIIRLPIEPESADTKETPQNEVVCSLR